MRQPHAAVLPLLGAVLLALALLSAGCTTKADSELVLAETTTTAPAPPQLPETMPDLMGLSVAEAHDLLSALGDGASVTFPAEELSLVVPASDASGTVVAEHPVTWNVPERTLPLGEAATDHYVISQQSLEAGEPLSYTTQLELVASLDGTAVDPWAQEGHAEAVRRDGAGTCFSCHEETDCSDCHVALSEAIQAN